MKVLNGYSNLVEVPVFLGGFWLSFMTISATPPWVMGMLGEAGNATSLFALSLMLHWQALVLACIALFIPVVALAIVQWGLRQVPFFTTKFRPTETSNKGADQ